MKLRDSNNRMKGSGMLVEKPPRTPLNRPKWVWLRLCFSPKIAYAQTGNQFQGPLNTGADVICVASILHESCVKLNAALNTK